MAINEIDTTTPLVGLKAGANVINANFTTTENAASRIVGTAANQIPDNSLLGSASLLDTGTGASQIPTNNDLGDAAYLDTGTGTGEIPTADDLSMVGETNWSTANYQPESVFGVGVVRLMQNVSGGTINSGAEVSGSGLNILIYGAGVGIVPNATAPSGTWKNVTGVSLANNNGGYFVRIS